MSKVRALILILSSVILAVSAKAEPVQTVNSTALIVTHASNYWDPEHLVRAPINNLIRSFKERNLPVFGLISEPLTQVEADPSSFPDLFNQIRLAKSWGGEHSFGDGIDTFVMTGGNLLACSCKSIRSILEQSSSQHTKQFYLVMDALYEYGSNSVVPWEISQYKKRIDQLSLLMSDEDFMRFVKKDYQCRNYKGETWPEGKYLVYRHGKFLGEFGSGTRVVHFRFELAKDLPIF